ncbi:MAG: Uma2 family endonuclease [Novosphingobium sp.]|nr:Uma2 family endonuclease [Novosphingobium sp.]
MTAPLALTKQRPARLTVADFLTLDRAGAFRDYSKSELIDGTIYVVNSQFSRHMKAKTRMLRRLADVCDALPGGFEAWAEGSVELSLHSMPEPDILITRRTPDEGPILADMLALAIEVADTTRSFDLGKKAKMYAANGLPEYWVVDLAKRLVHRHTAPTAAGYASVEPLELGTRVAALTIPGLSVDTASLD